VQFGRTLWLGDVNYVQPYRDDNGSGLNRVDPDGGVRALGLGADGGSPRSAESAR
jgi:hypothetical protein